MRLVSSGEAAWLKYNALFALQMAVYGLTVHCLAQT